MYFKDRFRQNIQKIELVPFSRHLGDGQFLGEAQGTDLQEAQILQKCSPIDALAVVTKFQAMRDKTYTIEKKKAIDNEATLNQHQKFLLKSYLKFKNENVMVPITLEERRIHHRNKQDQHKALEDQIALEIDQKKDRLIVQLQNANRIANENLANQKINDFHIIIQMRTALENQANSHANQDRSMQGINDLLQSEEIQNIRNQEDL